VAGGAIPGKNCSSAGLGQVWFLTGPSRITRSSVFSTLETNLANVAGTYNQLGYHEIPSQNYARIFRRFEDHDHADGTWQECDNTGVNAGKCSRQDRTSRNHRTAAARSSQQLPWAKAKPTLAAVLLARAT